MTSILTTIFGWVLAKIFGLAKQNRTEKKYVDAMKENFELRAQNAGLWKRKEVELKEEEIKQEWYNADADRKYEILKRDFSNTD